MIEKNLNVIVLVLLMITSILPEVRIFKFTLYDLFTVIAGVVLMGDGIKKRRENNSFGTMNMFISAGLFIMLFDRYQ